MFRHQSRREAGYRKHVPNASPVRTAAGRAQADDGPPHTSCVGPSKPASQPRGENTGDRPGRLSAPSGHVRTRRETLRFLLPGFPSWEAQLLPALKGGVPAAKNGWSETTRNGTTRNGTSRACGDRPGSRSWGFIRGVRAAEEAQLIAQFPALPGYAAAHTVLLYVTAFAEEINTRSCFLNAMAAGKRVLCPRVQREENRIRLFQITSLSANLEPGILGIPEPRDLFGRGRSRGSGLGVDPGTRV